MINPRDGETAVTSDDLGRLPHVEQIIKSLTKLIHGRKLYAENNPRLVEFRKELVNSLNAYFRAESSLVLAIDQNSIYWREQTVYENEKREESIAFLMHRDGIGEITIDRPAIGEEMDRLVQILADEYRNVSSDEDVVTKFWNADFEHISYRVLDDYLSVEYGETQPSDGEQSPGMGTNDHPELLPSLEDKGRVIIQRSDPLESIDEYLKRLILHTCPSSDEAEQEAYFQRMVGSFFTVSAEELNRYKAGLKDELYGDNLTSFVEATLVFTLLQDNPSAVRDISGVIDRIVDYAVDDLDPRTMDGMLRLVREFRNEHVLPEGVEGLCDRIVSKITDDTVIQSLGEKLKFWNKDSAELLSFFSTVGKPIIDPLLKVLHNVEGDKLHKEICDVLVSAAGESIIAVIEKLDIDKSAVAYDAVYIANVIEMTQMSPKIRELALYPDVAVKKEMIKLASRVDDRSSVDLLLNAINDEDKKIRFRAMQAAAEKNDSRVGSRMEEIAFSKELWEKSSDEQELVFTILGKTGDAKTVETLRKFVEKKSLIKFGKNRDNKYLAIRALEQLENSASLTLLKKLAGDSNELVKTRAQRAYDALVKRMREQRAKVSLGEGEQ